MIERCSLQEPRPEIDDQQLRVLIGLHLGAKSVLRKRATVVKELNETVYTLFLAPRVLFASQDKLPSILTKQTMEFLELPSMLEPRAWTLSN